MIINHLTLEKQQVDELKAHAQARFPVKLTYLEE
jgi:hypothetical protein